MDGRPNFLCIITDQQRADHLGCAGHRVLRTPNIDRLARRGVLFRNAYVNTPLCMPSRSTLFTGLPARGHRVRTNGIPLDRRLPTIVQALAGAGYRTHSVGKLHLNSLLALKGADPASLRPEDYPEARVMWDSGRLHSLPLPYYGLQSADFVGGHGSWLWGDYINWLTREQPGAERLLAREAALEAPSGADQSWKSAIPDALHSSTYVGNQTIRFLRDEATSKRPFFLWCSFPDPHHPFCPPAPWCYQYDPADVAMPTRKEGELARLPPFYKRIYDSDVQLSGRFTKMQMPDEHLREIIAHTYGMISLVDHNVGRIIDELEAQGLRQNTVVVFLSDHGDMMGDHWMINKGPFHFDGLLRTPFIWSWPGQFSSGRTEQSLVSFLDFAPTILDLAAVDIPEGLAPDPPEAPQQCPAWPGVSLRSMLQGQSDRARECVIVENDEDYLGLKVRTLVTERYKLTIYPGQPYGELFDRREDPGELDNRWADPAMRQTKRELQAQLLEQLVLTDSALPRRLCHA